ncbi:hypothetical protein HPB51_014868 [Rhipicephalus microplus]|uniref:Uncharacterized protein n=1 Tax=Rhipicephalus microplus TaxID=6941 RepID=A0A9J6DHD3_RHIMP|nr:hypothetical protein HPB51_014868 [Rhipicephalus microplus]
MDGRNMAPSPGRARGRSRGRLSTTPLQTPRSSVPPSPAPTPTPSVMSEVGSLTESLGSLSLSHAESPSERYMARGAVTPDTASLAAAVRVGRGAARGRRDDFAIVPTRPTHMTDKCGNTGDPVRLLANYFRLVSLPK